MEAIDWTRLWHVDLRNPGRFAARHVFRGLSRKLKSAFDNANLVRHSLTKKRKPALTPRRWNASLSLPSASPKKLNGEHLLPADLKPDPAVDIRAKLFQRLLL